MSPTARSSAIALAASVALLGVLLRHVLQRYCWVRPTSIAHHQVERQVAPPIDVVYAWSGEAHSTNKRSRNNNELKYSLRSLWKHASWVRRVHILVNPPAALPSWLHSPHVTKWIGVLDRCKLFTDQTACPTRNAFAVYSVVHRIPGLASRVLLMDDDTFLAHDVGPDFWFTDAGLPIVRARRSFVPVYPPGTELPGGLAIPSAKWAAYTHRVMPLRAEWILDFETAFPGYHDFVQSHTTRFPYQADGGGSTEEVVMMWYYAWWQRGLIVEWPTELCAFYNFPLAHPVLSPYLSSPLLLPLQFGIFHVLRAACEFRSFNVQDEWSSHADTYSRQMDHVTRFFESEYPQVPWFERPDGRAPMIPADEPGGSPTDSN